MDTLRFSFVIDPARSIWYYLGAGNSITFPAHSLCDPTRSTYGRGQWDKSCTLATSPLTVSAKAWIDRFGHPRVDFNPSVRFVPSDDPSHWVILTLTDYTGAQGWMSILYCPNANSVACFDESKSDPTLATFRDPATGHLTRRIKHFSGYNVGAGDDSSSTGIGGMDRMPASRGTFDNRGRGPAGGQNVHALVRNHPIGRGMSTSAVIGPTGGVLNLHGAGFTLVVPPGAVATPTRFQASAIPGNFLAYNFEPHGAHFAIPLLFVQDIRPTPWARTLGAVSGAYFTDDSQLDQKHGTAMVNELLNAAVNPFSGIVTFPVWHFSGYMLAD